MTSYKGHKKYCPYCNKEYWAKSTKAKYCSDRCRVLDNQRKARNAHKGKPIVW